MNYDRISSTNDLERATETTFPQVSGWNVIVDSLCVFQSFISSMKTVPCAVRQSRKRYISVA